MKNRDKVILKKILDYCNQIREACDMFENDYNKFIMLFNNSANKVYNTLKKFNFDVRNNKMNAKRRTRTRPNHSALIVVLLYDCA